MSYSLSLAFACRLVPLERTCPSQRAVRHAAIGAGPPSCNHANAIVACDLLVAATATFRLVYVFVVIEHSSRKLLHFNVTSHSSAEWALQQLRNALAFNEQYRYLLHDRYSIFAKHLDDSITHLGLKVLKSSPQSPRATAIFERGIGTIRHECLDWLIPLSESHLCTILKEWVGYYNGGALI